jgi:hypothetical protein
MLTLVCCLFLHLEESVFLPQLLPLLEKLSLCLFQLILSLPEVFRMGV